MQVYESYYRNQRVYMYSVLSSKIRESIYLSGLKRTKEYYLIWKYY